MIVLLMFAIPAALIAGGYFAIKGLIAFDRRVSTRFGHRFFSVWKLLAIVFGVLFYRLGKLIMALTMSGPSHGTNGIVLMAIGALLFGIVVSANYRKTNAFYGTAGTAIEIALSPFVALFLMLLLFGGIGGIAQFVGSDKVYVINQN
jgi:hypothetical protein